MARGEERGEQQQRLKLAKAEFDALLRRLLPECARGRSGLFGQHARALGKEAAARYYAWPEADSLLALSDEITALQEQLGDTTEVILLSAFLGYRAETGYGAGTGSGIPSEPRLALRFLQELKREEFVARGLPTDLERYLEAEDEGASAADSDAKGAEREMDEE